MSQKELVALVGPPNAGKTTLFNWLTNSRFKTVNYPGATVDYSIADVHDRYGHDYLMMDTPGTYSLHPKSADEEVTLRALHEEHKEGKVQKVICVVDGTQLERHLLLAHQIQQSNFAFVLVVTMNDLLTKNKIQFNPSVLEKEYGCKVVLFEGNLGSGVSEILKSLSDTIKKTPRKIQAPSIEEMKNETELARKLAKESLKNAQGLKNIYDATAKIDLLLLNPVYGLVLFFTIMSTLFGSIFWLAKPFMDLIDTFFTWSADRVYDFGLLADGTHALWADFISHGVIGSFGAIAVFVPQIFILFLGISLLEGTGYLARAATLIDKPFSKVGLSGRSFVPILSGFACAVPAIMATRNISSKRDRLITNLVIPLMTCSARLPVYALLLNFILKDAPAWTLGASLAGLYIGSLFIGALAAGVLNKILAKTQSSFFMMELPLYRKPKWKVLFVDSLNRTKNYVVKAGPTIFVFAVFVWVGTTFPNYKAESPKVKLESSWLSQTGQKFEPILSPMGVDWRVGVGLLSAFAAREVFVSSLAVVLNVADTDDKDVRAKGLLSEMQTATLSNGNKLFTVSSVLGLIVFFMIALQCMSTVSVLAKEMGSFKLALVELIGLNLVGYILAIAVVKLVQLIGW